MERIDTATPDLTQENIDKIAELFPDVVTEAIGDDGELRRAIDFDALRSDLADEVVDGPRERYQFTWPGKAAAKLEARTPCDKAFRPCIEESKDWDTTQNLYIEGDNLDALKLLRETYAGKVKLIYIDPPYNTGHDSSTMMISRRAVRTTKVRVTSMTKRAAGSLRTPRATVASIPTGAR